jgi:hypothetical protein
MEHFVIAEMERLYKLRSDVVLTLGQELECLWCQAEGLQGKEASACLLWI